MERALDLALDLGLYAYDGYILDAARSSGYPLVSLDRLIRSSAQQMGIALVEIDT